MEVQQSSRPGRSADASYRSRRERAYARVEALGLKRRWIARQVGRSVRCVTEVLRGTDTGAPTLVLIEILLRHVEAGEIVVPEEAVVQKRTSGEKRGGRR
jgi:hypothetical protein